MTIRPREPQNQRALYFHQNMTIPVLKDVAILGVIAWIANKIFRMDYRVSGAILLIGFAASVLRHLINYERMDSIRRENLIKAEK